MHLKNLLALCFLLSFIACDQSDEDESIDSNPKIKTMISYDVEGTPQTFHFEYDTLGRIHKKTFTPNGIVSYQYLSDTMIVAHTYKNEILTHNDSLWLNDQGFVITQKSREIISVSQGFRYAHTDKFVYNAEGYLIKSSVGHVSFEIVDGNTVKQILYSSAHPYPWPDSTDTELVFLTFNYEFIPNSFNTIGNENMGMAFWGKQNKNLVSAMEFIRPESPVGYSSRSSKTYRFDARKRVIKSFNSNGSLADEYIYYN